MLNQIVSLNAAHARIERVRGNGRDHDGQTARQRLADLEVAIARNRRALPSIIDRALSGAFYKRRDVDTVTYASGLVRIVCENKAVA